ncbi:MAG: hypothetical protein AAGL89_16130 [Pseudomonadota bacterium]
MTTVSNLLRKSDCVQFVSNLLRKSDRAGASPRTPGVVLAKMKEGAVL